ncbi:MAG: hypothetical protein AAF703_17575 [Cyanobacteria bacterium P01_D01_bin.105]
MIAARYRQTPLHWKINLSFIATCLVIWPLGTFSFAYLFSQYLERRQQESLKPYLLYRIAMPNLTDSRFTAL